MTYDDDPKPCSYCGDVATTVDHVVPQHLLKRAGDIGLDLSRVFRIRDWTVPACRECNNAIGGRIFPTLAERRDHAHDHIRRKYRSYLKIPHWTEEELAEMGPRAQDDIRKALRVRDWARRRLSWTGTRNVEWAGDVYLLMRQVLGAKPEAQAEVA